MDPTLDDLQTAFLNADKAGDQQAAAALAQEIQRRVGSSAPAMPATPMPEAPSMTAGTDNFKPVEASAQADGNIGQRIMRGLGRGMASVVGLPAELDKFRSPGFENAPGIKDYLPDTKGVMRWLREHGIDLSDKAPSNVAERYIDPAAEFAGGMALGPTGSLAKRLLTGATAGGAGQAGVEMLGPYARLPAEILSLLIPGYVAAKTPSVVKALQGDLKQLPDGALDKAQVARESAEKSLGVPVMLHQAIDHPNALEGTMGELQRIGAAPDVTRNLINQLVASASKSRGLADEQSTRLITQETANLAAKAGKDAVEAPAKWRTARTQPYYDAAGQAPLGMNVLGDIIRKLRLEREAKNMARASEGGSEFVDAAKDINSLQKEPLNALKVAGLAREQQTSASRAFNNPNADGTAVNRGMAQGTIGRTIKEQLKANSPEFAAAERAHKNYSGPAEQMAASRMPELFGNLDSKGASFNDLSKVLTDESVKPDQVRFIARNLAAQDPQAFGSIMKENYTRAWDETFGKGGRVPQDAPQAFVDLVAGSSRNGVNTNLRSKFLVAIEENARAQGKDPAKAREDAEALANALQVVSQGRDTLGRVNPKELQRLSGENPGSDFLRAPLVGFSGGSPYAAALERAVAGKTYAKIVDAFMQPDTVARLRKIAEYSPAKQRAGALLTAIMGLNGQNSEKEQKQPDVIVQ